MDEHRIAPRRRLLKGGKISFSNGAVIDCTIRNLSETGAARSTSILRSAFPSASCWWWKPTTVICRAASSGARRGGSEFISRIDRQEEPLTARPGPAACDRTPTKISYRPVSAWIRG